MARFLLLSIPQIARNASLLDRAATDAWNYPGRREDGRWPAAARRASEIPTSRGRALIISNSVSGLLDNMRADLLCHAIAPDFEGPADVRMELFENGRLAEPLSDIPVYRELGDTEARLVGFEQCLRN